MIASRIIGNPDHIKFQDGDQLVNVYFPVPLCYVPPHTLQVTQG